jgi:hypothetical protein
MKVKIVNINFKRLFVCLFLIMGVGFSVHAQARRKAPARNLGSSQAGRLLEQAWQLELQGKCGLAIPLYQRSAAAQRSAKEIEGVRLKSDALRGLGRCYEETGQYAKAL